MEYAALGRANTQPSTSTNHNSKEPSAMFCMLLFILFAFTRHWDEAG
jgi:hypothetical protein